jgi:alanyl-tRNA synthetase
MTLKEERELKKAAKLEAEKQRIEAMREYEEMYDTFSYICGIDEAGRGPLAGPVVAGVDGEKANLVVVCGKNAVAKGAHAGKIAGKVAALTGGKGGGRPDSAMAGIGDRFKIDEALDKVNEIVGEFVK